MKTIRETLASLMPARRPHAARWLKPALILAFGLAAFVAGAAPANDNFASAFVISGFTGSTSGDNLTATLEPPCETNQVNCDDDGWQMIGNTVWFAWKAPTDGTAAFDTFGSDFDTVLAVWTTTNGLCGASLTNIIANDDDPINAPQSSVGFPAVAGTTYYIQVSGYPTTTPTGNYVLNWNLPPLPSAPANDNFTNAIVITGSSGEFDGTNNGATMENCEPGNVLFSGTLAGYVAKVTNSVWFQWTAPASGRITFSAGGSFLPVLAIYTTPNDLCSATLLEGNDNLTTNNSTRFSQASLNVVAGTTYYISVNNFAGDLAGSYRLLWNLATLQSGSFKFSSTSYVGSQTDSSGPISPSVNPSVPGIRVTITRPEPAHGRVLVDYSVVAGTYNNLFTTNFFGTNLLSTYTIATTSITTTNITDTNNVTTTFYVTNFSDSFTAWTNAYSTNVYIVSSYQSWNGCSFQQAVTTNGYTNSATLVLEGVFTTNFTTLPGPLTDFPTNLPITTNYTLSLSSPDFSFITNVFGVLSNRTARGVTSTNGSTYTNGLTFYNFQNFYTNTFTTNSYGTNIYLSYTPGGTVLFSTNYYYTNIVSISTFYTNSIYTNGGLSFSVTGTNQIISGVTNFACSIFNAANRQSFISPNGAATNLPPAQLGNFNVSGTTTGAATNTIYSTNYVDASSNTWTITTDVITNVTAVTTTNIFNRRVSIPEIVSSSAGITLASGTLTFDDFQMSRDIIVPVAQVRGPDFPAVSWIPSFANIVLSNPRLDPLEDANSVIAPTLDPFYSKATISAQSTQYTPYGWTIFNFERSTFRVNKNQGTATIYVRRFSGDPQQSVSVDYVIDPTSPLSGGCSPPCSFTGGYQPANTFPLQAGSDYATPNTDYTPVTGTLNWAAYDFNAKPIDIPILNDGTVEFNKDMLVQLYNPLPGPPDCNATPNSQLGEVNSAILTILFDSTYALGGVFPGQQPAGAVDRTWNKDGAADSTPPFLSYPGTTPGFGGTVYAVATQPDGNSLIAGSFVSFDSTPYNRIVRTLPNGYQDPTFQGNSSDHGNNSGANDFIAAVALQPDGKIIIGGNFTSFNGNNRHYIARLNSNGSVDTTFNPGLGANARVWSVVLESSGQIVIGGEFTTYNGTAVNEVARLNPDGSLDTTFNPGAGPDGIVDAVAVDTSGRVIIGGNFANVSGTACGAVARLNVDGSLDTTFTPGIGTFNPELFVTDSIHAVAVQPDGKVLIGGSFSYFNLVSQNGLARLKSDGTLDLTFQPGTGTFNPFTGVADTVYAIQLQPDNNILIGGNFTTYNQTHRIGLARVLTDGSLDTSFMDTTYNHFAGVPNQYFNSDAAPTNYPYHNTRNSIYAIALETSFLSASNIIIGGSFERVGGGSTRDDIHPRSNVARVIGGITPGPGNLEFAQTSYTVNNSDGRLYVSLIRTNGNLGVASATFSTNTAAPGPGVASGGDFGLAAQYRNPTWGTAWTSAWDYDFGVYGYNQNTVPVNVRTADVYVTVTNSGNISGNLSANFALSAPSDGNFSLGGQYIPSGVALGTVVSAPLTIIDSNVKPGVLGFSSPVYTVIENGTNATITLTRTNGSDNAVSVWYATSNGTATNGIDYTGVTNQVNFAIRQTNATFTVSTLSKKTSIQPDKTVNLRLFTPGGGATLGLSNAVLTLVNKVYDYGHVSFSLTNYPVNENAGSAVITVNRLGGSVGTLGVTLLTRDGTAFNGTNYSGSTNVLFWNNNDATPKTIVIPVMRDGVVTPNLVAFLQLTNAQVNGVSTNTPLTLGGTNATLTIVNVDSAGSFQFSLPVYSVKKYGGYALIPVIRAGGSVGTASVNFTTADGTALQGVDYLRTSNTLTFANGELSKFVSVPILPSTNGLTDLFLRLDTNGLATLASLGSPSNSILYIIDSDTVDETPGSPDPTYSPFAGFNNDVYALALQPNNQLLAGGDFTMANGVTRNRIARLNSDGTLDAEFSLPSSSMGADGSVRALALQADGRILVGGAFTNFNSVARRHIARVNPDGTLDNLFNPGAGADNPVYAVAQTFVDGQPKILLAGAFASINGTTFNGVGRLNSDGTPDSTFNPGLGANATVYALALQTDGKIVIGGDFTAVNGNTNFNHVARLNVDGSLDSTFIPGTGASASVRAITIQLDGRILLGGLFTSVNGNTNFNHIARLNSDGSGDASFTPGLGANDAVFSLSLQSNNRIVVGGTFTMCNGVTRNRITRLNPDGTVDPSINFGTGANGFVAATVIQQDTIADYPTNVPDEKIIIAGGFTQYHNETHQHIARIFGGSIGGSGAFQFSAANYGVHETGTNVIITVWRTGGTTNAPTGDVFVTAIASNGTAVAGVNYTGVTNLLDFPLGEVIRTFTVWVRDDGVVTNDLTVNLALASPTTPAQLGNQPTAVLTITNDDTTVSFSSDTYSVPKNIISGTAAINVVRKGGTSGTATVGFTTTDGGTAVPGTDYTPVSQTVTFNPGISNVAVYIPINNNGIAEGNRTVTMQLTAGSGSVLVSPTNAILTIIDTVNAPGQLAFSSASYTITEGGGVGYTNAYITVIRANGSSGTVSVGFQTQDGTAQAGIKYVSTNGVLTFADGESSKTFVVPVINTPTAEGPESVLLVLSNPTGGAALTSPALATLTIFNTNTGIAFVSAANSFTEPSGLVDGIVSLNVVRFNNTNGTTTVNYSTTNGTAVAGINFVGITNATLTFYPGDSIKPIVITTRHDPRVTGDLFFTVGLANPSGSAQLTSPSYTVVTDHDADAGISFLTNAASVFRNAGYIIIPVICSNTNVEPVSVNYSTGGGSAVPGTDYTATSGTLFFTNGAAINYFYVLIPPNNQVQSNRTFNVTLSGPTPPGVLQPPSVETITIVGTNTPYGLSFLSPIVISGVWGTTNADNSLGSAEIGDPSIAGQPPVAPVWFQWTAPLGYDGEVALDTIGSVGTNGVILDTVLAVFTGSSLSTLSQVAANDDLYPTAPSIQINEAAQNIWNTNAVLLLTGYTYVYSNFTYILIPSYTTNYAGQFDGFLTAYTQPFIGPSGLRFNAKGGTTYYIAADTKISITGVSYVPYPPYYTYTITGLGKVQLNWAYHSSGVFRFATENVDETGYLTGSMIGTLGAGGNSTLLYQCSESEGGSMSSGNLHRLVGPYSVNDYDSIYDTYYPYDVQGLLVTVTRVAGSSGRVSVDYTTVDGTTNNLVSGDIPAIAGFDYSPVSGTLIFDDYEMSKTIVIPIIDDVGQNLSGGGNGMNFGVPRPNRDFTVVLSNPTRDPAESSDVSAPRVDSVFGKALCRILDCDIDPKGPTSMEVVTTNITFTSTNYITNSVITDVTGQLFNPTNALFNFSKANYRVPRDVESWLGTNTPVAVFVNRSGTNTSSVTLHYRFDNWFLTKNGDDDRNNEFPLQPGSDYAVPTPANAGGRAGVDSDFAGVGGDSGTLTFPGGQFNPYQSQVIHFTVQNNHIPGFAKDIHIGLYEEDSHGNPLQDGMVAECTVTILFDDTVPPAGSVDQFYNPDLAGNMATLRLEGSLGTSIPNPGTDPISEVYAVALMTNNQAVIGGSFATYSDNTNTYTVNGIARLNSDGSLDTSFNSGSGVNVFPGGEFIRSLALTPDNKIIIGGDFSSYNGIQREDIARVNADGSLDTTFRPGNGADGTVWSVLTRPDGTVLIGGEFTHYNGVPRNHVARLLSDGTLDTSFDPGNRISGPVYAMAFSPLTSLNFTNSSNGTTNENDQVINLGLQTGGTLLLSYDMIAGPDQIQLYYGDTNVAGGTGVLLYDSGAVTNSGNAVINFGPVNGFVTNLLTVVMNPGGATNPLPLWTYTLTMAGEGGLLVGGSFNVTGQSFANLARLNQDGSLDAAFIPGTGPNGPVYAVAWQPDDKVVVGGSFNLVSGTSLNNLARFNGDGTIDSSFMNGIGADNTVYSITLKPVSGLIYVGGPFTKVNGTHRLSFARLYPDGTVDTTFLDTAYNQFAGLPRVFYRDQPSVYSSAIQSDGNVIIGGSFQQVGGGQADKYCRYYVENERGLIASSTNVDLSVSMGAGFSSLLYGNLEPKSRDGVRNHSNVARLIGGATPGPGNIGMLSSSYAVNRTQTTEPVTLTRYNGSLGYASANFAVLPGLAQSGSDYSYSGIAPVYPISWEYFGPTRMHSDGLFGDPGLMQNRYGQLWKPGLNGPASINISIYNNAAVSGNLSAQFQMANPATEDIFYLGGQNIPVGVALGISQSPLTIVDNTRQDGVFGFAAPVFVATNSPTQVSIVRTNGTFGVVQVSYQTVTNGSTAALTVDYLPANGVVTFASGQTNATFPITVVNNSYVTSLEKFINVQLFNIRDLSGGTAQLGLTNAQVRVINPNFPGYLSFNTNAYYANLSSGAISFTVTRTVGSKGTLTLQYGTINGTALNTVDYVGATNTLTWNNGDVSSRTVSIPLINHNVVGPNRQFAGSLFNAAVNGTNTPALLGAITNAVFAIVNDNNYGTFQFGSPSYLVNENGGYATITVTRSGSGLSAASVSYATADATAFAGTNYVATNGTLNFVQGQVSQSFNVRLLDDGKTNPPPAAFYFGVALSSPSPGAALGSPTNTAVHIVDAESYNQQAGSLDPSFDPMAGMNASVLALALQSSGQIVAGGSFTVANGASQNRIVRLNTDGTLDSGFLYGLGGADGSVNAVVSQTDDRIVVGGAFAKIDSITRQRIARLMTDGSLDTSFNPGSGADSAVFTLAESFSNGAREIYAGGAFSTFNGVSSPGIVRLNNDGSVDTSFATGQGANGTVYAVAVYPTNSVYNAGKVLVGGLFTNFNGTGVANLVRLNADGSLDTNFSQTVSANSAVRAIAIQLDESVLIGGDFTNVNAAAANRIARLNADGTLDAAFNTAATSGINGTVNAIAVQPDNRILVVGQFSQANGVNRQNITRLLLTGAVDPSINFGLGANGAINATVIQPADGNLVIGGDFTQFNGQPRAHIARLYGGSTTGSGAFQFTTANYQVDENASFATITIARTGGTSGTNADGSGVVYVAFTTTNGSAKAGTNYTYTTNYLDFPVGEVFKTVYVPVMDDLVITSNLTVNLLLSNPTPGTGLGDQASAVLTIVNVDSAVYFQSSGPTVPKNTVTGFANISIVRQGSTSGSCTVNFATGTNGTAVVGTDYYPTNALITFSPGATNVIIQIAIINNLLPLGDRTVTMALTNAVNTLLASPSNATLTIIDNSTNVGNLFFTATNFTANASDGLAYLTVGRINGKSGSVAVTYTTYPGTALPGFNYEATTNTLTFNDGDTNKTFTIPLINNPVAQSSVSLTVSLSNPTGGAGLIAPTNTILTINNTNAAFAFTLATNTAAENFSPASVVVRRFNNTNIVSTVNYATTNGTALAGVNYSNTAGMLTFGVGETFKSISVPLINRSNITDLAFGVGLFSPTHAQLIAPSNTVVILQASAVGVSFITNRTTVQKNAGSVLITVVCSNPRVEQFLTPTNPLSVTYLTADGTAKAGINYQAVTGTLVFTNGNATNTFLVPIFNNQSVSGDQVFTVLLTNVTAPGRITPYATQEVVIAESNAGMRFSQADYSVFKNAAAALITVYRTGYTDSVASVDFSVTNGTAIGGQNFYPTNGTLVFTNGVTSQSFNVALIANSLVQPNLFASLRLSNPTNSQIVNPGAATLTILETGGSYVIPAGAQVVTNYTSHLNDGIIGSNDTVKVLFGFRDSAGLNVTNLIAYLLATNGVVSPSPASQTYGPLTVYGHSVSREFTFTAHGTNTLLISPAFQLYDNGKYIGPATFTFTVGAWTTMFANTNVIYIIDNAAASLYPSLINVSGVGNKLVKATVTITNLTHYSVKDIDALVVSPTTNTLIMAHVGQNGGVVSHVTLTFDDAASNSLPQNIQILTGTNKPTQYYPVKNFP